MDVGPHVFDLVDLALGPIDDIVSARRDVASDTWSITAAHEGGGTSSVTLSMRTPVRPSVLQVTVSGSAGVRELDKRTTGAADCYSALLDAFLESVKTGVPHPCSAHRGLYLQKILDTVLRTL